MRDQDPKPEFEPQAAQLTAELRVTALRFREQCRDQIERLEKATVFWKEEHDLITNFLVRDQMEEETLPAMDSINIKEGSWQR